MHRLIVLPAMLVAAVASNESLAPWEKSSNLTIDREVRKLDERALS